MTSGSPVHEILDLRIQISDGFYPVRLNEDIDSDAWALDVVRTVAAETGSTDPEGAVLGQLTDLRIRLLAQLNPYLTAAVYVRPERYMSLGVLLAFEIMEIEADQGPDWYEANARTLIAETAGDVLTISADTWQGDIPAGRLVGVHQVSEYAATEDELGWIEARCIFAVFPPNSSEMVLFTFTTADLGTFGDMPAETQLIVESLELDMGLVE